MYLYAIIMVHWFFLLIKILAGSFREDVNSIASKIAKIFKKKKRQFTGTMTTKNLSHKTSR